MEDLTQENEAEKSTQEGWTFPKSAGKLHSELKSENIRILSEAKTTTDPIEYVHFNVFFFSRRNYLLKKIFRHPIYRSGAGRRPVPTL